MSDTLLGPRTVRSSSALSHAMLGPGTIRVLCMTMVFAILAGVIEGEYLSRQEIVSSLELVALILVMIGLAVVLGFLILLPSEYLDRLALSVFVLAIFYIFSMLIAALFLNVDTARSLHTVLWFHPAFIAVTLTQPTKISQWACWIVITLLSGVVLLFGYTIDGAVLDSTLLVNHWIIILSLGASASLLYGLSVYREQKGADNARIEVLQLSETALRAEVNAKQQALAEAARANSAMTSFLDNISHELRTPLNAVIGFSEIIRDEMFGPHVTPRYKEYADDILSSGRHLLELVSQLIYFTHLSGGKIPLVPVILNADQIFNEVIDNLRSFAGKTQISIIADTSDQPAIVADREGVTRILTALLDNAIKFSVAGNQVYLQAKKMADGGCEISVRDTGIGISQEEQTEIFKPFRKGKASERSAIPGTGMGLTTAKALVELHGGVMSFESQEGQGTRVSFTLPARGRAAIAA